MKINIFEQSCTKWGMMWIQLFFNQFEKEWVEIADNEVPKMRSWSCRICTSYPVVRLFVYMCRLASDEFLCPCVISLFSWGLGSPMARSRIRAPEDFASLHWWWSGITYSHLNSKNTLSEPHLQHSYPSKWEVRLGTDKHEVSNKVKENENHLGEKRFLLLYKESP